jgi:hypothetical protein
MVGEVSSQLPDDRAHNVFDRTDSVDRNVRTDWGSELKPIDEFLLPTELGLVSVRPAGTHPLQQFLRTEIEPNHCHGPTTCSLKSINEFLARVKISPFLGKGSD